jgi:REP element-mobilizing transposase RayT
MGQRHRYDSPGAMHHVMNRGPSKRVMLASEEDMRAIQALMACGVRRGEFKIVAFTQQRTHYHLLLHTEEGSLSYGMMRLQNVYSRRFNRRTRRDGSLVRGRFRSRLVDSFAYWHTVIRYIDHNPVRAGLCLDPAEYPWGSARHYATSLKGPPWLDRELIEAYVASGIPGGRYDPSVYRDAFGTSLSPMELEFVQRRMARGHWSLSYNLDDLLAAPPDSLQQWMAEKARRADGGEIAAPVAAPSAVLHALRQAKTNVGALPVKLTRRSQDGWDLARVGLLRDASALELERIAETAGVSVSTVHARLRSHRAALRQSPRYAQVVAGAMHAALHATFPKWAATEKGRVALRALWRGAEGRATIDTGAWPAERPGP